MKIRLSEQLFRRISEIKVGATPAGVFWIPQHAGLDNNGAERFNNYDARV